MRISRRGQITIPKVLRDQFGMNHNVEVEIVPAREGLLIHKRAAVKHPVEGVYGILDVTGGAGAYLEEIRGR